MFGLLSPVIKDSSAWVLPSTIIPSTASFIPGLQIKISPTLTSSIVTSFSPSLVLTKAFIGVICTKDFIASLVFSLLLESIYLPSFMKYITTPALS